MLFLLASLALASVPDDVTPVAAPPEVPGEHAAWLAEQGRPPAALACEPLWPKQTLICFRVVEKKKRRWVTERDLARWGVDPAELRRTIAERAGSRVPERLSEQPVEGMRASYLTIQDENWAAGALLRPELLAERLGGPPVLVALPADGHLLAWKPGNSELDTVMAVAAQELHDKAPGAVSPVVHLWDGAKWRPFAEAVKEPEDPAAGVH